MQKTKLFILTLVISLLLPYAGNATLFEYYQGELPSIADRSIVYNSVYSDTYFGSYEQNIALEDYLRANDSFGAVKGFRPSEFSTALASSLAEGGSETELIVNSLDLPDGTTLNDAYYGDLLILTVGEGSDKEKIAVTTLDESTKTFTISDRGLEFGRWATSTSNIKQHLPGDRVYISNDDHFIYNQIADLDSDQTLAGRQTFTLSPILPTPGSSDLTYGANVEYVNNVATSGSPNLSTTIKGIGEGATASEQASNTELGGTGAKLVLLSENASSTSINNGTIIADDNGELDASFINDNDYTFSGQLIGVGIVGEITAYASSSVPTGWLAANGASVSTTTYSNLFALVGYTYGGSGGNFNLPDLSGRNIIGYGTTTDSTIDDMGETGGATTTVLTEEQLASHDHNVNWDYGGGAGGAPTTFNGNYINNGTPLSFNTSNAGSNEAHPNMDPFIVMQYIIKY